MSGVAMAGGAKGWARPLVQFLIWMGLKPIAGGGLVNSEWIIL
jgi:hypothetical protein